jgi:hypothetical protein
MGFRRATVYIANVLIMPDPTCHGRFGEIEEKTAAGGDADMPAVFAGAISKFIQTRGLWLG